MDGDIQTFNELVKIRQGIERLIKLNEEAFEYHKKVHKQMDEEYDKKMQTLQQFLPNMKDLNLGEMMKNAMEGINEMTGDKRSFDSAIIRKPRREYPKEEVVVKEEDTGLPEVKEGLSSDDSNNNDDQDNAAGAKKKDLKSD